MMPRVIIAGQRAAVASLLLVAVNLLPACRSSRSASGNAPAKREKVMNAAASAYARAMVGPPPSSRDSDAGAIYAARIVCGGDAAACIVDLADGGGHPVDRWDFAHLASLTAALRDRHVTTIVLSADPIAPYASVVAVLDAAREAGTYDVSFGAPR
jgi:hypothetical protein